MIAGPGLRTVCAAAGLAGMLMLAACAELGLPPRSPGPVAAPAPARSPEAQPAGTVPQPVLPAPPSAAAARDPLPEVAVPTPSSPGPLVAAPNARRRPIDTRRIDLNGSCVQAEEDGFREQARLLVRNNEVRLLAWQLWVGRKGGCRFDHAEFTQTRSTPHIELLARDGSGCKLMVWQDPRRVTLAHAGCQKRCSGGIYEQAWPVMFDPASGACASFDR